MPSFCFVCFGILTFFPSSEREKRLLEQLRGKRFISLALHRLCLDESLGKSKTGIKRGCYRMILGMLLTLKTL